MADEKKSQGFTIVSNEVVELKIPPLEKIILIVLLRYYNEKKGYSYPSYATLTEKCCITKKTLIKGLNNLEEKRIIKKECVKGKGNKYFILVENLHQCKNYTSVENTPHQCKNYTTLVENLHPTNTNINTNTITNNNMSDFKKSDAPPGAFKSDNKKTTSSKNKKTYSNEVKEVVEYLNLKANRNYRPGTTKTKSLISARLKDYTVEDLKAVIDFKVGEWLENEKMNKYLRPETLFNETKFENYINELPSQATEKSSQSYLEDTDVDLSIEDIIKINLGETNNQ